MINISFEHLIFSFILLSFSAIAIVWFFYDRRDRKLVSSTQFERVYHCVKCGHLYSTDAEGNEVTTCPSCKFKNSRLKF